jgi:hypothetical protein
MRVVYRVVEVISGQEMNRFTNLVDACVLWVKYSRERRVEEMAVGTNDVIRRVSPTECCAALRKWLPEILCDQENDGWLRWGSNPRPKCLFPSLIV